MKPIKSQPYVVVSTVWSKMETNIQTGDILVLPYPQHTETHFVMADNLGDACIEVQKLFWKSKNQREVWFGVSGSRSINQNCEKCREPVLVKACFLENGYSLKEVSTSVVTLKQDSEVTELRATQRRAVRHILNLYGCNPSGFFTHNVKTKGYKIKLWGFYEPDSVRKLIISKMEKIEGFKRVEYFDGSSQTESYQNPLASLVVWFN